MKLDDDARETLRDFLAESEANVLFEEGRICDLVAEGASAIDNLDDHNLVVGNMLQAGIYGWSLYGSSPSCILSAAGLSTGDVKKLSREEQLRDAYDWYALNDRDLLDATDTVDTEEWNDEHWEEFFERLSYYGP